MLLTLDEMAIKKQVYFDGKKYHGFVDIGNGVDDDSLPCASNVLVFMVVCLNNSWKVPIGYFFINGMTGIERANLIRLCIQRLSDIKVRITSVTCDGPSGHIKMLSELGASMEVSKLKPFFNLEGSENAIYVLLDICHMIKLVCGALAHLGVLLDPDNNKICWSYLVALLKLQESEGLRLANKLKISHIHFWQQKMKVNLATQIFSNSVADALEFCAKDLKKPEFQGCEATVKFIRIFNNLFDILNSRNPFAKGTKAPMGVNNKTTWEPFLNETYEYILGIKDLQKQPIWKTKRKTGFIGFLVGIKSVQGMFHDLVESPNPPLTYLLTYKFSQDHLELFFGAVRAAGGCNNNPTAYNFLSIYKRLLLRSSIQGGKGNVTPRDDTTILHLMGDTLIVEGKTMTLSEAAIIKRYDISDMQSVIDDYAIAPKITDISEYKKASVSYIGGFVANDVIKRLSCYSCIGALGSRSYFHESNFIKFKDRGNLFKPTKSVIKVCEETEKAVERMLNSTSGKLPHCKGVPDAIATAVLNNLGNTEVFSELNDHALESPIGEEYHIFSLIKMIAKSYCKIRFYHLGKLETEKVKGPNIRKKLSKLILFQGQ